VQQEAGHAPLVVQVGRQVQRRLPQGLRPHSQVPREPVTHRQVGMGVCSARQHAASHKTVTRSIPEKPLCGENHQPLLEMLPDVGAAHRPKM
jgi:hypothetical protein